MSEAAGSNGMGAGAESAGLGEAASSQGVSDAQNSASHGMAEAAEGINNSKDSEVSSEKQGQFDIQHSKYDTTQSPEHPDSQSKNLDEKAEEMQSGIHEKNKEQQKIEDEMDMWNGIE